MPGLAEDDPLSGIKIVSRDKELTGEVFEVVAEAFIVKGFTKVRLKRLQRKEARWKLFVDEMWQIAQTNLPVIFSIVLEDPQKIEWQACQRKNRCPPVNAINITSSPVENRAFIAGDCSEKSAGINAIGDQGGDHRTGADADVGVEAAGGKARVEKTVEGGQATDLVRSAHDAAAGQNHSCFAALLVHDLNSPFGAYLDLGFTRLCDDHKVDLFVTKAFLDGFFLPGQEIGNLFSVGRTKLTSLVSSHQFFIEVVHRVVDFFC